MSYLVLCFFPLEVFPNGQKVSLGKWFGILKYIGRRSVSHRPWYTGLARKSEIPNCYLFVTHCCSALDVINHTVPSAALLSPQAGFYMWRPLPYFTPLQKSTVNFPSISDPLQPTSVYFLSGVTLVNHEVVVLDGALRRAFDGICRTAAAGRQLSSPRGPWRYCHVPVRKPWAGMINITLFLGGNNNNYLQFANSHIP